MTEDSRVAFILSLLTGDALAWADPLIRAQAPIMSYSQTLMDEMAQVFDHDVTGREAAARLTRLKQGNRSVAEFSVTFRALAGETGWADEPLITLFVNAISDPVKDALVTLEPPATLSSLISTAIRIDNRVREREREKGEKRERPTSHWLPSPNRAAGFTPIPSQISREEPMQVDSSSLRNTQERKAGRGQEQCRYCRKKGHTIENCFKLTRKGESH